MRILFAIGVAFLLSGISAVGCGGYPIVPPMQEEDANLPAVRKERQIVEAAGAEALRQYIVARLSMEELAQREAEEEDLEELAEHVSIVMHLWQDVEETAGNVEKMAEYLRRIETTYPAGRQIEILAKQLERDAKAAQILMKQTPEETLPKYGEAAAFLREKCSVVLLTQSMGGSVHRETPEAETAATWFWDEADTMADIRLASSKVLLGSHPHILFLVDDAEIRSSGTTLAIPADSVEELLPQYMDAAPDENVRQWLKGLEAELRHK